MKLIPNKKNISIVVSLPYEVTEKIRNILNSKGKNGREMGDEIMTFDIPIDSNYAAEMYVIQDELCPVIWVALYSEMGEILCEFSTEDKEIAGSYELTDDENDVVISIDLEEDAHDFFANEDGVIDDGTIGATDKEDDPYELERIRQEFIAKNMAEIDRSEVVAQKESATPEDYNEFMMW